MFHRSILSAFLLITFEPLGYYANELTNWPAFR